MNLIEKRREIINKKIKDKGIIIDVLVTKIGKDGISRGTFYNYMKKLDDDDIFNKIHRAIEDRPDDDTIQAKVQGDFYNIIKSIDEDDLFSDENSSGLFPFSYKRVDNCFFFVVPDDSMTSVGSRVNFNKGELIFIDTNEDVIDGDYVLILLKNGRTLFREYNDEKDHIILRPNSRKYRESVIHKNDIKVMYRVCGHIGQNTF